MSDINLHGKICSAARGGGHPSYRRSWLKPFQRICKASELRLPGDLKTRKRTGTSFQIEIHFSIKTTKYLFKYTLLCSQIYDRFIILFIKRNHKVSASFIKEKQRYK